jgi:chromosome segregation ATPase
MIASSIAMGPMTLRGEETEKKTPTVQDVREKLDGMKETVKKTLETIEEKKAEEKKKIEEADKKIKESKKRVEESNKKVEESNKRVEESNKRVEESNKRVKEADKKYCAELETNIPLMKDYCSKNECGEEQNKILKRSLKDYKEICEKLVVPAPEEKKEKK